MIKKYTYIWKYDVFYIWMMTNTVSAWKCEFGRQKTLLISTICNSVVSDEILKFIREVIYHLAY